MGEPELVARCVAAMHRRLRLPVTVKCRIGIDEQDSERDLDRFIGTVADAGCQSFIVHARKAWLKGLSPKQNRELPPLDYARVWGLKAAHAELEIVINGGIATLAEAQAHLEKVDGVAIGRSAYQNPYLLATPTAICLAPPPPPPATGRLLEALVPYVERTCATAGGSTISCGTFWASITANPTPAPFAGICRKTRPALAPVSMCCLKAWR